MGTPTILWQPTDAEIENSELTNFANNSSLLSGTFIVPTLGSIVQKGKLADWALALDRELNNVDLPTLGSPTIPHLKAILFFANITRNNILSIIR